MAHNPTGLCKQKQYCQNVADCPRVREEIKKRLEAEGKLPNLTAIERACFIQKFKTDGCPYEK